MTKEEILRVLKANLEWQYYTDGNDSWDSELKEAVTEAIKLLERQPSDDCVSRAEIIKKWNTSSWLYTSFDDFMKDIPLVTPTHGTCKDCKKYKNSLKYCTQWFMTTNDNFYCADFKKRGNENGSN